MPSQDPQKQPQPVSDHPALNLVGTYGIVLEDGYELTKVLEAVCSANSIDEPNKPSIIKEGPTSVIDCSFRLYALLQDAEGVQSIKAAGAFSSIT